MLRRAVLAVTGCQHCASVTSRHQTICAPKEVVSRRKRCPYPAYLAFLPAILARVIRQEKAAWAAGRSCTRCHWTSYARVIKQTKTSI
eukprot:6205481-Pleurochrysis_carterae.AAC.2